MSTIFTRPDGLYIPTHATWPQLATDDILRSFANGLIPMALNGHRASWTLAELLHHSDPQVNPLLTALLVLDAEVNAIVDDKQPVFPLPGFLTYRTRLSPDKFPLSTIRLPPLKPDGHYLLSIGPDGFCAAIRLDLNPHLKLARYVRTAISSQTRSPIRLPAVEQRLERQILDKGLIRVAIVAASEDGPTSLTRLEQDRLTEILAGVITD